MPNVDQAEIWRAQSALMYWTVRAKHADALALMLAEQAAEAVTTLLVKDDYLQDGAKQYADKLAIDAADARADASDFRYKVLTAAGYLKALTGE